MSGCKTTVSYEVFANFNAGMTIAESGQAALRTFPGVGGVLVLVRKKLSIVVVAVVAGGSMLHGFWRSVLGCVSLVMLSSCGMNTESRVKGAAPQYLIARAEVNEKDSSSAKVEFVSVSSEQEIASAGDAEKAFLTGEPLLNDDSGVMRLASDSSVQFSLGSPTQMPSQMPTQSPAQVGKVQSNNCYGKDCTPVQVQTSNVCECYYRNGIVRSNQNTVVFPRVRSFFRWLNPFATVRDRQYAYNYGNQYSQGQYQYSVYKQNQYTPVTPVDPQSPYSSQTPGQSQVPSAQYQRGGALTGL